MAGFKSILSAIGHVLGKVFSPGVIRTAATVADIALPQFSALINVTASAIINAETAAIAAGQQSGSGAQKSAMVLASIEASYTEFAAANNFPVIPENMKAYVDAAVAMLNSFPAPPAA